MNEKPDEQPAEEPQDGVYQVTPSSRASLVTTARGKRLEVEFDAALLQKKLGAARAARVQAARKTAPVTKQVYVQPKGWQKVGDAFLAGPLVNNPGLTPVEFTPESQITDSAMPSVHKRLPNKVLEHVSNNLGHAPDLNVPLFADRSSDNVEVAARLSWRYWFSDSGRAELGLLLGSVYLRLRSSTRSWWMFSATMLTIRAVFVALRHERMLWNRMGLRPYLRLRKYKKHGPPPAVEVQWPGMSSLKMPEGYAADPSVLSPESARWRGLQAALDVGHAEGLPTQMIVKAFVQTAANEGIFRTSIEKALLNLKAEDFEEPPVVKPVSEVEFKAAAEKDTITCSNPDCGGDGFLRDGPWGNYTPCPACQDRKVGKKFVPPEVP